MVQIRQRRSTRRIDQLYRQFAAVRSSPPQRGHRRHTNIRPQRLVNRRSLAHQLNPCRIPAQRRTFPRHPSAMSQHLRRQGHFMLQVQCLQQRHKIKHSRARNKLPQLRPRRRQHRLHRLSTCQRRINRPHIRLGRPIAPNTQRIGRTRITQIGLKHRHHKLRPL